MKEDMSDTPIKNIQVELKEIDVRYILYAISELMAKLESEIKKDPDGEKEITPMYADDILSLRDIKYRLRERAVQVFGVRGLSVSYKTL